MGKQEARQHNCLKPFGFAGRQWDRDTSLVYFGGGHYNPSTGRFMQKDPIGFAGGDTNLYRYCFNNPINCIDPKGTDAFLFTVITPGGFPHRILAVTDPRGGITTIDFGPTEDFTYTGTVPGAVDVTRNGSIDFGAVIGQPQHFSTTPEQDAAIINRGYELQQQDIPYNPFGLFGGDNCVGVANRACGNVCQ